LPSSLIIINSTLKLTFNSNSHGRWSPDAFPNLQKAIARVKTQWLERFFILSKSSWNVDV
jgi:hypothetical protein